MHPYKMVFSFAWLNISTLFLKGEMASKRTESQ